MRRLKQLVYEAVGFGENTFSESDFDYRVSNDRIEQILVNKDKQSHDGDWSGKYYRDRNNDSSDVVGFIEYKVEEKTSTNQEGTKISYSHIYVSFLENREEYRQTKAIWFLLDRFKQDVINPNIDKYGIDRVFVSANFANDKLGRVIKKYLGREGIHWISDLKEFIGVEPSTYDDLHESGNEEEIDARWARNITEKLFQAGAEPDGDYFKVENFPVDQFLSIITGESVSAYGSRLPTYYLCGHIEEDGSINYELSIDDNEVEEGYASIRFYYEGGTINILDDFEKMKEMYENNYAFLGYFPSVFGENATIEFTESGEDFGSYQELQNAFSAENNETSIASIKIKRLIRKS